MMLQELTTPDASELPVRAFADHLKLGSGFEDDGSEDAVLEVFLRSAIAAIEVRIGKALIARNFGWDLTRWISDDAQGLPIAPVNEITAVTVYDQAGGTTVASGYVLEKDMQRPVLTGSLPPIPAGGYVEITFEAGFGAWDDVPADLRHAVLLQAASFYENRSGEGRSNGMPFGVMALIESYRSVRLGGVR